MRDFYKAEQDEFADIVREPFTFAGVEFRIKPVMPADVHADLAMLGSPNFDENAYDFVVSMVRRCLLPEYRAKWDAVLAQEREVPITLKMLYALINAISEDDASLVEEKTGRPTMPLSPSGDTRESTRTNSTDASASPAAKASPLSRSVPV